MGDGNVADRTQTDYDGAGRAVKATAYNGLTATWSTQTVYGGNQTTVIPPTGGVAQTTVTNDRGWTTLLEQYTAAPSVSGSVVTGSHVDTTYGYTALGQQKSVLSSARTWSWGYDNGGRVINQNDPDAGASVRQYDDLGELTQTTDANQVVLSYAYDQLGRKTATYHTATQTAANELDAWVYDSVQAGQLSYSLHFTAPTTSYKVETTQYDYAGRPLDSKVTLPTAAEPDFAASYSTTYSYTTTGLLKSTTPAAGGSLPAETLGYTYDNLGEPTSMRGTNVYVGSANYTAFGQPQQYQLGVNSYLSSLTYSYDAQTHRLTDESFDTTAVTSQVEDQTYAYDPAGNVVKTVDTQGAPGAAVETQCFRYTARDQLGEAWSATDGCASDPSVIGNGVIGGPQPYWTSWNIYNSGLRNQLVQHAVSGSASGDKTTSYSYNLANHADGLSATSGALASSYQEDAVGNVTTRTLAGADLSLTYDYENRTASVTGPGGSSNYVYDADGHELMRHDATTATLYLPGEELTRNNSAHTITGTRSYAFNGTQVAVRARASASNPYFVMADPHGSGQVAALISSAGLQPAVRRYLDPYGNPLGATSWPDSRSFLDAPAVTTTSSSAAVALQDVGARKYDPLTGRFLSADPVFDASDPQSLNGYAYADSNPISKSDPSGLHNDDHSKYGGTESNYNPDAGDGSSDGTGSATQAPSLTGPSSGGGGSAPVSHGGGGCAFFDLVCYAKEMGSGYGHMAVASGAAIAMQQTSLPEGARPALGDLSTNLEDEYVPRAADGTMGIFNWIMLGDGAGSITPGMARRFLAEEAAKSAAARAAGSLAEAGTIDPSVVRFSQNSISGTFRDGGSVKQLAADLKSGTVNPSSIPPIRVLERNGNVYTLDNRRLAAFQEAGVEVPYRLATPEEVAREEWKFTTTNDGTSILIRGGVAGDRHRCSCKHC